MSEYRASMFLPGPGSRPIPGRLKLEGDHARFESAEPPVTLSLSGLTLRSGGHDGRQVFVEHRDHPGAVWSTSDAGILSDPLVTGRTELRTQARSAAGTRRKLSPALVLLGVVILLCVGVVVAVFLARERIVDAITSRIPTELDAKLGELVFEQIKSGGRLIQDERQEARLRAVTSRLVPALGEQPHAFRFHLMADTNLNAFALPGGHIVVHTGLMNAVKRPEDLAGVIAHELAHVVRRHSVRQLVQSAGMSLAFRAVLGDLGGLQGVLIEGSATLLQQKYSRDFEREADELGWAWLVAAQVDPRGMIDFFRLLEGEQTRRGAAAEGLAFLSTHPATTERIRVLEAKWAALKHPPEWRRLQWP